MTTYIIMNGDQIINYYRLLRDAKFDVKRFHHDHSYETILAVEGNNIGEGYHKYKLTFSNGKFIKQTIRK